ncbi:hypothetical protein RDABS01_016877 [Bienertia sinuspersici]
MQALATFTKASGLAANTDKSTLYGCNIPDDIKAKVLEQTGFVEEKLPFRYLGVKISSKKLSTVDCDFLTDKIVSKIRTWEVRTLSYPGRTQLVNVVLLNLHSYWAAIFVIPKKVIDQVIAIFRNFLWTGHSMCFKNSLIAWDLVCRPKLEGGLGFKESHDWNLAMLGKYVWCIAKMVDNFVG